MNKYFLYFIFLAFFFTTYSNAEPITFGCKCVKHNHKNTSVFGMRLDKSEKQCPKIQSNFYLDQEKMEVYGDFWHSTWDDKYMDFGEEVYIKYKINENKENKLSASVFKEKGYRQKSHTIDIFKKNDNFEIVTFWDYKPFKKGPWVWRSYNCEIVNSNIGILK